MPIVQITAGHPVRYSTNNGFTMTEFDHGELYDVPVHVARGMLERNWARLVTLEELQRPQEIPPEQPTPTPPVTEPSTPAPRREPDEENGDDDDDKPLVAKKKRR